MKWLSLLVRVNSLNRKIKENDWDYTDQKKAYDLKDSAIEKILTSHPKDMKIEMFYIPYIKYGFQSKDRAGMMMRQDRNQHPFEYYLAQVEPSAFDYEVPEKATVEICIDYMGLQFSFHQPYQWMVDRGYAVTSLPKKAWISPRNFAHTYFLHESEQINILLQEIN